MKPETLRDILEWDVASWKPALAYWDTHLEDAEGCEVLDIGARHGGLSLYFALRGCRVVCTDLKGPSDRARALHQRYGVSDRITYASVDATDIPFPEHRFDLVCCKSVLGGVSKDLGRIRQAVNEIHRVLKPGGGLLFAENLKATPLHMLCRRLFLTRNWRYPSIRELRSLFADFAEMDMRFTGCLAAFGRNEKQRRFLSTVDQVLSPIVPRQARYIAYGYARKAPAAEKLSQARPGDPTPP